MKVASELGRHSIGYELSRSLMPTIKAKLGTPYVEDETRLEFRTGS
jgi:hypothetical protein